MSETFSIGRVLDQFQKLAEQTSSPEYVKKKAAEMEKRENAAKASRIELLKADWNAPKRHLSNFPKLKVCGQWGEKLNALKANLGRGSIVALVGGRGPGKTQMAVELMRGAVEQLRSAYFLTATEFFMRVKATYRKDSQASEVSVVEELGRYKLLVIDEIGKRGQTDWENNLIFELINNRYNEMKDTILIDNNEPDKFVENIGASLASRITETGGIVHCNWPSFRE